jgi:hypothetical protein
MNLGVFQALDYFVERIKDFHDHVRRKTRVHCHSRHHASRATTGEDQVADISMKLRYFRSRFRVETCPMNGFHWWRWLKK